MPKLQLAALATAGLLYAGSASALPLVDVDVGARYWRANPTGDASYKGDKWDMQDDLGFDKEGAPNLYGRLAFPLITVDAEYTKLAYDGKVKRSLTWGGQTASLNGDSSFDATLLHAGAMFNVPLPVVDLGLGLGATNIDAEGEVDTATGKKKGSVNATLPVAQAELRVDFPALPLNAGIRGQAISYDGDSYRDITAEVGVELGMLQIRAGYRQIAVDYKGNDFKMDSKFSGPFAGAHLAF
ncbi:MAG TPA: TIGR04219 family outer membrane beta-barrel protein [Gammaproteobacteria bacterium]|nr:TIGR04219 family outer membrane beta-barrel protein [Gammaproteobacteria bacterium]